MRLIIMRCDEWELGYFRTWKTSFNIVTEIAGSEICNIRTNPSSSIIIISSIARKNKSVTLKQQRCRTRILPSWYGILNHSHGSWCECVWWKQEAGQMMHPQFRGFRWSNDKKTRRLLMFFAFILKMKNVEKRINPKQKRNTVHDWRQELWTFQISDGPRANAPPEINCCLMANGRWRRWADCYMPNHRSLRDMHQFAVLCCFGCCCCSKMVAIPTTHREFRPTQATVGQREGEPVCVSRRGNMP